jgi:anti-anti-sigma factor
MEIQKQKHGDQLELRIQGRLDAYWSDHLTSSIDESIRQGSHRIQLNLAQVDYLSSAGIRVLLKFYKQLAAIKGSLAVIQPSDGARSILAMAGLSELLIRDSAAAVAPEGKTIEPQRVEKGNAVYDVYEVAPGATLQCGLVGDPTQLEGNLTECRTVSFPDTTFGLGLGAFGTDFADCHERFGEFLALAGTAAYLPTDDTNVPDYMVSEGALVPEMKVLYALSGKGQFAQLIRFDAKPEPPGMVPLAGLVEAALEISQSDLIGVAMIAESAGLVGAALRRSPAKKVAGESPLKFPAVRDWLSFTGERAFDRTLCVVVGVAARNGGGGLKSILRPIGFGANATGHFHAAVFPYRPLQRGELNLHTAVNGLFTTESMQSILHLLPDDRDITGVGQSEFLRGAVWAGPIAEVPATS